ncbi:hypothetical protein NQ176_g9924 [Zarea fungicola]|uniref:Uncharacterized protein n=1 Tax=Zarea fungicola TaxID=93591 RepID=A0ACC1MIR8_9HYPO|nr:hypothetical protein NQ176_g9924 [Lecanicillium fungicola]
MVRTSGLLTLLATATTAVIAQADIPKPAAPQAIQGAYIVEFEDGHDRAAALSAVHEEATTRLDLNFELFNGVSIQLNDVKTAEEKAEKLAALPAVKNIWPVVKVPRPNPKIEWVAPEGLDKLVQIAPSGKLNSRAKADQLTSAQRMGQIEKLRAKVWDPCTDSL